MSLLVKMQSLQKIEDNRESSTAVPATSVSPLAEQETQQADNEAEASYAAMMM